VLSITITRRKDKVMPITWEEFKRHVEREMESIGLNGNFPVKNISIEDPENISEITDTPDIDVTFVMDGLIISNN
jgi:hypothetical protein